MLQMCILIEARVQLKYIEAKKETAAGTEKISILRMSKMHVICKT